MSGADRPTFVFSGGGSGGHLFPGLAVAEQIVRRLPSANIVFVGSGRPIEKRILGLPEIETDGIGVPSYDKLEHYELPVEPTTTLRQNPIRFGWRNWRALRSAKTLVRRLAPAAVVGLGGFASVPVVMAASQRCPIVLLEQNAVPGRATRWLHKRAVEIHLMFEAAEEKLPRANRIIVTGNPVRAEVAALHTVADSQHDEQRTLLVLGGSQGAVDVNTAVVDCAGSMGEELDDWQIVHQTGERDFGRIQGAYDQLDVSATVSPFIDDMVTAYRHADIVVCRAGATTLAELACAGCPAIVIPHPTAMDQHQLHNAKAFESAGAAYVVEQSADSTQTASALGNHLRHLIADADRRRSMREAMKRLARPSAAGDVAERIIALATRDS